MEKTGLFKMPSKEEVDEVEELPDSQENVPLSPDLRKPSSPSTQTVTSLTSAEPVKLKNDDKNITREASKTSFKETTKATFTTSLDKKIRA